MKNVITIDGPSGSGKGTISKMLAERLGYSYLDTGALYRAVAWKVKHDGVDPDDGASLKKILDEISITFNGEKILVGGEDITAEIRTAEIGELSSRISAIPMVREGLFSIQREMGLKGKVVIEGRDAGTAIFPESENKFYLDASLDERARRRFEELKAKDPEITLNKTVEDIKKRDHRDSTRERSPLTRTADMVYIDSTDLSKEEVVKEIMRALKV